MTDLNTGMFIHNKLHPYGLEKGKRFCRVIGASIYSSILKTKKMTIAYKVGWWDEEPVVEGDFATFTLYRSQKLNNIIQVFELDRRKLSKDELIAECIKHFLEVVPFSDTIMVLSDELNSMYEVPVRRFRRSKLDPPYMVTVWDLLHKVRYESTNGLSPEILDSFVKYRGNFFDEGSAVYNWDFGDNGYIQFDMPWKDDFSFEVIAHLDTQATIDYCDATFGNPG